MTKTFEEEFKGICEKVKDKFPDTEFYALPRVDDVIEHFKDWQPQQALPVVPECVDKTVELLKKNPESSWSKLYSSLGEEGVTWLNEFQHKDERFGFGGLNSKLFVLFHLAINGYTVEKQQLFYLKHIDMSKNDEQVDWYMSKAHRRVGHNSCEKRKLPIYDSFKFTQQEIDSMNTGSYEHIEVEK